MYSEVRDLHINAIRTKLSVKTKRILAAYEVCTVYSMSLGMTVSLIDQMVKFKHLDNKNTSPQKFTRN